MTYWLYMVTLPELFTCIAQQSATEVVYVLSNTNRVRIGNEYLELSFDKIDGKLLEIKDKTSGVQFVNSSSAWQSPFWLTYVKDNQSKGLTHWQASSFQIQPVTNNNGKSLILSWKDFIVDGTPIKLIIHAIVSVENDSSISTWDLAITNQDNIAIERVSFPVIQGIGSISADPLDDYLAYPSLSGLLFQDPLHNMRENTGWHPGYPSAYANMQFLAYYSSSSQTGVYFAAHDGSANLKTLSVYKPAPGRLTISCDHYPEKMVGANFGMGYLAIIGTFSGDWFNAAQIYRRWATQQSWVSKGSLFERTDIPKWYLDAGFRQQFYTRPFGLPVNPFSKVSEILADSSSFLEAKGIGVWIGWEKRGFYLEEPDVFPPKEGWDSFGSAIAHTHETGNSLLCMLDTTSYSSLAPSWPKAEAYASRDINQNLYSLGDYFEAGARATLYAMCPGTEYWQTTLKQTLTNFFWRDIDMVQLDGFPVVPPFSCYATNHAHPKGLGNWWTENYKQIFNDFKSEARKHNPNFVLTSEGMAEPYLSLLDTMEDAHTTSWSPITVSNVFKNVYQVQMIPMWQVIYHDYLSLGAGFSQVSRLGPTGATGFTDYRDYYIRGFCRALIWGEMPHVWYADEKFSDLNEDAEREMALYLKRIVKARCTYAKEFLVFGKMLREPTINVPSFVINGAVKIPCSNIEYPPFISPKVLCSSWESPSQNTGHIFSNISRDRVNFSVLLGNQQLPESSNKVMQYKNGIETVTSDQVLIPKIFNIEMDPLDIILIKIVRNTTPDILRFIIFPSGEFNIEWKDIRGKYTVEWTTNINSSIWVPFPLSTNWPIITNRWHGLQLNEKGDNFYRIRAE